jgi:hypothetical protein
MIARTNLEGHSMNKSIILATVLSTFALGSALLASPASAQSMAACEKQAVSKDGKPLSGAAKTSSVDKCMEPVRKACEAKAIDKNGKQLAGAAMSSFMKKCEAGG